MPSAVHHLRKELYSDSSKTFRIHMSLRRKREALIGDVAAKSAGLLRAYLTKHAIPTHSWLILPDRISLIIQPTKEKTIFAISDDIQKLIKDRALPADAEFFGDFLDHLLRATEDPKHQSAELLTQPVILGLAPTPKEYPYCGTMLYQIEELSNLALAPCYNISMPRQYTINDVIELLLDFKGEFIEFKDEMTSFKGEMLGFKNDMTSFKGEMTSFKAQTEKRFDDLETRLDYRTNALSYDIASLRTEMHDNFKSVREDINVLSSELIKVQRKNDRRRTK